MLFLKQNIKKKKLLLLEPNYHNNITSLEVYNFEYLNISV